MIDTNTRLMPPAEVTAAALSGLHPDAAAFVEEAMAATATPAEHAHPINPLYRGRHRTTEDVNTRRISPKTRAAAVEALVDSHTGEHTALIPVSRRFVGSRTAEADDPATRPRSTGLLGAILRAVPRGFLRGAR